MSRHVAVTLALFTSACLLHRSGQMPPEPSAIAVLRDSTGAERGTAVITAVGADSITIVVRATGLTPGLHGIHLHAVGRCDAPAFASAGAHLNPAGRHHGLENPEGPHAGDLPNLADGRLQARLPIPFISLFDADGTAVIVHAGPDDQRSDPAGNSGPRILCGVPVVRRGAPSSETSRRTDQ